MRKNPNSYWFKLQMDALRKLQTVINEIPDDIRPADSEDEKEEEIWETIDYLKAMLSGFFKEEKQ